jgi:hypothetical protein
MGIKQNQNIYIPAQNPILLGYGFTSDVYYSVGKAAQILRVDYKTVLHRVNKGAISFVKVNDRFFLPSCAITQERIGESGKIKGVEISNEKHCVRLARDAGHGILATMQWMGEGKFKKIILEIEPHQKTTRVQEFIDLDSLFVVGFIATDSTREIFAYKIGKALISREPEISLGDDALLCAQGTFEEERFLIMKKALLEENAKESEIIAKYFLEQCWHYGEVGGLRL